MRSSEETFLSEKLHSIQSHIRDLNLWGNVKKKKKEKKHNVPQRKCPESVQKALIVLYLRHAFVPVTDSPSGWSVLDLIAVYIVEM